MARRFFLVSLGILALVLAYQIGASRTEAQGGAPVFAGIAHDNTERTLAITTSGDVYFRYGQVQCDGTWSAGCAWVYAGNVLSGPVPVEGSSWGQVKSKFGK